jgi:hypothetical protein
MDDGVSNARPRLMIPPKKLRAVSGMKLPSPTAKTCPALSKTAGWDGMWTGDNQSLGQSMDSPQLPETSVFTPSTAGGRVIRRYNFQLGRLNRTSSPAAVQSRLPQISHFDVRMSKLSFASDPDQNRAPAPPADTASTVPTKCDYLRVYYSDFLSQHPTEDQDRPRYLEYTCIYTFVG